MATDQTIVLLTVLLTVFFLLSVLLFILYSRNLVQLKTELEANVTHNDSYKDLYRVYQESLQKNKEIALNYTRSEANCKALNALLEQAGEQRKQLRKEFVEQSEIATQWRQKHDKVKEEVTSLESELDRGNEIITWLKADLEKAYKLNAQNEDTIASLLALDKIERKSVDFVGFKELEKLYKTPFSDNSIRHLMKGVVLPPIDFNPVGINPVRDKGIDHQLRSTEGEEVMINNEIVKVFPMTAYVPPTYIAGTDPIQMPHNVKLANGSEPITVFKNTGDGTMEVLGEIKPAIDWTVPQPFPKHYVVPVGINVVAICSDERVIKGDVGITIKESVAPVVEWSRHGNKFKWAFCDYELAPLNPTDHPLHPEFKAKP
jgi:hypothetical protein